MSKPNDSFSNKDPNNAQRATNLNPGECVLEDGTIVPCGPNQNEDAEVTEVSFIGTGPNEGWDVKKDSGSGSYSEPHWKKGTQGTPGTPERTYPYLYKQGTNLKIKYARFHRPSHGGGDSYRFRGKGPNGIDIPATAATLVTGTTKTFEIKNVVASKAFAVNQVKFYDKFEIQWEISTNLGPWVSVGKSKNPIYVSLAGSPNGKHYYTVVHLACSNDGATDADTAVTNSWALLSGPSNFLAWDESTNSFSRKLYYYREDHKPGDAGAGGVEKLLQNAKSNGQCSTWASLFREAIKLNNAASTHIRAEPDHPQQSFLVKDWTFPATVGGVWNFQFPNASMEMHPEPANRKYGDLTNLDTEPGQNTAPPAQKVFINHQFVKYTAASGTTYYDPSYGLTYGGANQAAAEKDFQDTAIDGFGKNLRQVGTNCYLTVTRAGAATQVSF